MALEDLAGGNFMITNGEVASSLFGTPMLKARSPPCWYATELPHSRTHRVVPDSTMMR